MTKYTVTIETEDNYDNRSIEVLVQDIFDEVNIKAKVKVIQKVE